MGEDKKEEETPEIAGCITSQARELITDALYRRAATLDPKGLKAQSIMKLIESLKEMDGCEIYMQSDEGELEPEQE